MCPPDAEDWTEGDGERYDDEMGRDSEGKASVLPLFPWTESLI